MIYFYLCSSTWIHYCNTIFTSKISRAQILKGKLFAALTCEFFYSGTRSPEQLVCVWIPAPTDPEVKDPQHPAGHSHHQYKGIGVFLELCSYEINTRAEREPNVSIIINTKWLEQGDEGNVVLNSGSFCWWSRAAAGRNHLMQLHNSFKASTSLKLWRETCNMNSLHLNQPKCFMSNWYRIIFEMRWFINTHGVKWWRGRTKTKTSAWFVFSSDGILAVRGRMCVSHLNHIQNTNIIRSFGWSSAAAGL